MLKKDYTAKLLNLEDVIITKVENISKEVHVYLELPRTKHRCPACGALTDRVHDYRMQIIRDFPLAEQRCCICASGVTAATAASASLRRTPSFLSTTVPPVDWWPKSSPRSVKRYPLQRSAHSLTFRVQRLCGTSNAFLLSQPDCQRFFPLTNSKGIPAVRNTTVSL